MESWLIAGLGNPGPRYSRTRHNAGWRAAATLATELGVSLATSKHQAELADAKWKERRVLVARPTTYMNDSGVAVGRLCKWHKISPNNLIVLHDEIDLPACALRLKFGGSTAGNHGLDSIVEHLGTRDFYRIRIGVGRSDRPGVEPKDYVLERMTKVAADSLAEVERLAAEAALAIVDLGLERAKSMFNRRGPVE